MNKNDEAGALALIKALRPQPLQEMLALRKGDVPGHEFHGNQHTGGGSSKQAQGAAHSFAVAQQLFSSGGQQYVNGMKAVLAGIMGGKSVEESVRVAVLGRHLNLAHENAARLWLGKHKFK
jgi:hypothetical protein